MMDCPKCQHQQKQQNETCESCGIVFAKYEQYLARKNKPPVKPEKTSFNWQGLVLPEQQKKSTPEIVAKCILIILISIYSMMLIFSGLDMSNGTDRIIHLPNLIFHEAGHAIFGFMGQFIGSLGGTLGQLLMPLICFYVFFVKQKDIYSAAVTLWWFGENFIDIAPYVKDASRGVMPLLGGNTGQSSPYGFHDWEYLLTETGLINYDNGIAWLFHLLGSLIMIAALIWSIWIIMKQSEIKGIK